jgi:putative transposase
VLAWLPDELISANGAKVVCNNHSGIPSASPGSESIKPCFVDPFIIFPVNEEADRISRVRLDCRNEDGEWRLIEAPSADPSSKLLTRTKSGKEVLRIRTHHPPPSLSLKAVTFYVKYVDTDRIHTIFQGMAKRRWIVPWTDSETNPAIYHCVSRVVDRRFAFGLEEKERFRSFMRMYEKFTGCRVLSYCLMDNHIHLLLEVTPRPAGGLKDVELLSRVGAICDKVTVGLLRDELAEARALLAAGRVRESYVEEIHTRYTYRMHDLSEFMKGLMQRFTQWFNGRHQRSGTLWERAFKSVVVEDGEAARTMAAYIDLNPVRAGMVSDPAEYRWSSYGEAVGGGAKGNGKRSREGLVRAWMAHKGWEADASQWSGRDNIHSAYRALLLAEGVEKAEKRIDEQGKMGKRVKRKGMPVVEAREERDRLETGHRVAIAKRLRWRLRYFSDGVVIGSREFVDGFYEAHRDRFGPKRTSGARRMRGDAAELTRGAGLYSLRDLTKGALP